MTSATPLLGVGLRAGERRLPECYVCITMGNVGIRELRNHTTDLVHRVQMGEVITITSRGIPVAELHPVSPEARRPIGFAELTRRLARSQADPGLRDLLRELDSSTDDLRPIV